MAIVVIITVAFTLAVMLTPKRRPLPPSPRVIIIEIEIKTKRQEHAVTSSGASLGANTTWCPDQIPKLPSMSR